MKEMKEIAVESWGEFQQELRKIESQRDEVCQSHPHATRAISLVFRGQADACWSLETTLERQIRNDRNLPRNAPADFSAKDYLRLIFCHKPEIETRTGKTWDTPELQELERQLEVNLECLPAPMYDFMAYLRHLNFPSPFLDWTASPYVAAYFAFRAIPRDVCRVAIYANLDFGAGPSEIGSVGPTIKAHVRHFSQQSQYTYCRKKQHRDDGTWEWVYSSHEEAFGPQAEHESNHWWKITIPASERKTVLRYLDQHNVTGFSLFHSDESLMETLALREFTLRRLVTVE